MDRRSAATTVRPLNGEELLSIFSQGEPTKLQLAETIATLADENARLKEENARRKQDQHRQRAYILRERHGSGKSELEWINLARLAAAHCALTTTDDYANYEEAAGFLIKMRPAIRKLLKENRGAQSFTDKKRIIQLRKNFQSKCRTKSKDGSLKNKDRSFFAGVLAYRHARREINRIRQRNPGELAQFAEILILAIDLL
jgi:hypothetical protein